MTRVRFSFLSALMFFAGSLAVAQTTPAPGINQEIVGKIPERMKHAVDEKTVAGVVTLIARGNDVVEFDAEGMADIEANRPMRKDTINGLDCLGPRGRARVMIQKDSHCGPYIGGAKLITYRTGTLRKRRSP